MNESSLQSREARGDEAGAQRGCVFAAVEPGEIIVGGDFQEADFHAGAFVVSGRGAQDPDNR